MTTLLAPSPAASTVSPARSWKIDPHRGQLISEVSRQWLTRPDDQKFLSLADLETFLRDRTERSREAKLTPSAIRIEASSNNPDRIALHLPNHETALPTHWSFGRLAQLAGAPAGYLRQLPATLAAINLQWGLADKNDQIQVQTLTDGKDRFTELRAATGPDYGRIPDFRLVSAIRRIAGDGTGDTRWKVPGRIDWGSSTYNPFVDITKETTTLYASDQDVFVFLVDDLNPIEIGKLPDGSPDLYFRGFYAYNSEVGARTLGIATFFLRGVCANRNIWGAEEFRAVKIRHTRHALSRFTTDVAPALQAYANSSASGFRHAITSAKGAIVAKTAEERLEFLQRQKFTKPDAEAIIEAVTREEGHPPRSVFDFVQGITATARALPHQDTRLEREQRAAILLKRLA
ncbi:DUF932 domain-containing protein [Elstera cyanobacteriorum]|uniref:DUF932 domain-containing protein n=1 Tax=Elstera cyanobacteriorum TaxID=2022747 RepID=UPI0023F31C0B|nr:DUF932 domain-containing protein [Elstera cyanobacteriorum]